jgi:hypothetical protein
VARMNLVYHHLGFSYLFLALLSFSKAFGKAFCCVRGAINDWGMGDWLGFQDLDKRRV